jgi:hypothetical protein
VGATIVFTLVVIWILAKLATRIQLRFLKNNDKNLLTNNK